MTGSRVVPLVGTARAKRGSPNPGYESDMTTLVANEAVTKAHMAYLGHIADTGPGSMHDKTANGLIFTQGPIDFVFTGSGIKYIAGFPIGGTITGLDIRHDGDSAYKFSGFSISVAEATSIWLSA